MPESSLTQEEFRAAIEEHLARRVELTGSVPAMLPYTLVRCDVKKATLALRTVPDPWTRNQNGVVHGGIVATLFDGAMGTLSRCFSGDHFTPTISMTTNYARPVPIATPLIITAELNHMGSSTIHLQARLSTETEPDKTLATAQAVYYRA